MGTTVSNISHSTQHLSYHGYEEILSVCALLCFTVNSASYFNHKASEPECTVTPKTECKTVNKPHVEHKTEKTCGREYSRECRVEELEVVDSVYKTECKEVPDKRCKTVYTNECEAKLKEQCRKVNEEQCEDVVERECNTIYENRCEEITVTETKCEIVENRDCNPIENQICTKEKSRSCRTVTDRVCTPTTRKECKTEKIVNKIMENKKSVLQCMGADLRQSCQRKMRGCSFKAMHQEIREGVLPYNQEGLQ